MNTISILRKTTLWRATVLFGVLFALGLQGIAQTAADTQIKNQASASYGDGGGNSYSTVSNEVTVTVAKVGGLAITPDAQSNAAVVAGQTGVTMDFLVANTGNFNDQVRFLANGASFQIPAGLTATAAVVDPTGTPVNILTNGADVLYSLNAGASVTVRLTLSVSAAATTGSTLRVYLGDQTTLSPTFDNDAANSSANEVRTVSTGAVNGSREGRGDISVLVQNDAQIRANLTAPAGPVNIGSNITYTTSACNDGARSLSPIDPDGAGPIPAAVYVIAPIPVGTELASALATPAGVYYSTTALTTAPLSATWTATAPGTLSTVRRIMIPVSTSALAVSTCSANFNFDVKVTAANANTPIYEIVDAFGVNSIGATITDQSGDNTPNKGDGNANFDEPLSGGTASPTQGFQQPTTLTKTYNVLNGPNGNAGATGPTNNNDDFTNLSVNTGIAGVVPGGNTTASGSAVFTNTVQNTGNADDTFVLTTPTVPTGSTVEISINGGTSWTTVSGGASVNLAVGVGSTANYLVRVTLPAGNTVLTGYNTVVRATSQNDNTKVNDTINRLYTGFVRLVKTATVANATGVGGATDPVPGAVITYSIVYTNISSSGGSGNAVLTASNLVITENGNTAPNNWGSTTDQVVGSASDTNGGTLTGDSAGSSVLTDTIATLAPGGSGTFSFKRTIK